MCADAHAQHTRRQAPTPVPRQRPHPHPQAASRLTLLGAVLDNAAMASLLASYHVLSGVCGGVTGVLCME